MIPTTVPAASFTLGNRKRAVIWVETTPTVPIASNGGKANRIHFPSEVLAQLSLLAELRGRSVSRELPFDARPSRSHRAGRSSAVQALSGGPRPLRGREASCAVDPKLDDARTKATRRSGAQLASTRFEPVRSEVNRSAGRQRIALVCSRVMAASSRLRTIKSST
jgi:hypothetical protein